MAEVREILFKGFHPCEVIGDIFDAKPAEEE
jgi:hypothetical protein